MATLTKSKKSKVTKSNLSALMRERKVLASRLNKLERQISRLGYKTGKVTPPAVLDRLLDELASRSTGGAGLPVDFSRADLYDDHD
jgi:hypothetical protein